MATRQIGVDVSGYQRTSMTVYHSHGAKFMIVKGTEGTWYRNPLAVAQVASAHRNHMYVHLYHFANFGNSTFLAKQEAKSALREAHHLGVSKNRFIWLDWEYSRQNYIQGSRSVNTKAIIEFMSEIKKAGYKAGLYSGASVLRNNLYPYQVTKKFGTCLWTASYPVSGATYQPNFGYFPSMNGVAVWQFTDNWKGLQVDGNVSLIDINAVKVIKLPKIADKPKKKPVSKPKSGVLNIKIVYAPIINHNPNYMISLRDQNGHATGKYIRTNTRWRVVAVKYIKGKKYYKLGTDRQFVPAKYLKLVS